MWKCGIIVTLWLSPSSMGNLPDLWWENSTFPNMHLPRGKLMLRCQFCIHAHLKMPEKMEGSLTLGDFGCWEGERGGETRLATHQRAALFWSHTAIIFHCLYWSPFLVVQNLNTTAMKLHRSPVCSTIAPQEAYNVDFFWNQCWKLNVIWDEVEEQYCNEETFWQQQHSWLASLLNYSAASCQLFINSTNCGNTSPLVKNIPCFWSGEGVW